MELTFNNGKYVGELRASAPFNLHIEGGGTMSLFRRTSGESYRQIAYLPCSVLDTDVNVGIEADYKIEIHGRPSMVVVTLMGGEVEDVVIPELPSAEPEAPEGYAFLRGTDGIFLASNGPFFVKL